MLFLIQGKEEYFIEKKKQEIISSNKKNNSFYLNFSEKDFDNFYKEINSNDIFSKGKILCCYLNDDKKIVNNIKKDNNLKNNLIKSDHIIIFITNVKLKLINALGENNINYFFIDDNYKIEKIKELLIKNNFLVNNKLIKKILTNYNKDYLALEKEIISLNNTNKNKKNINLLLNSTYIMENDIFKILDLIIDKDIKKINKFIDNIDENNIISITNFIFYSFKLFYKIKILKEKKLNNKEIAKILNIHIYRVTIATKLTYSTSEYENILLNIIDYLTNIKKGLSIKYGFKFLIYNITICK